MFVVSAAVWALTDSRAGHTAHTRGIAQALGTDYAEKKLEFNALSRLPERLLGASLTSLSAQSRAAIRAPWPAVVIASGRRMVPIMRYIKQHSPKTRLVQCLWPGRLDPFDIIAAPEHDELPTDARIIRYCGALHNMHHDKLNDATLTFQSLFDTLPKPHLGVLIGGHSAGRKARLGDLHHLLDTAEFLAQQGSLILTTSRRTPAAFHTAIRERLTCPYHLHLWGSAAANPYLGMLALCDALIVSGDSISMLSEACYTGKPVLVDTGFHSMRAKHHRACESFFANGHALPLRADTEDLTQLHLKPLDEITRIAPLLRQKLGM